MLSALLISLGWFWLVGNSPEIADNLRSWESPFGAWWFVYALWLGSVPGGLFARALVEAAFL